MHQLLAIFSAVLLLVSHSSIFAQINNKSDTSRGKTLSVTCIGCHGADGNSPSGAFPKIAGQHANYLFKQLKDFKSKTRSSTLMLGITTPLSDQDMRDLSAFFASQIKNSNVVDGKKKLFKLGKELYHGGNIARAIVACAACHGPSGEGVANAKFPVLSGQHVRYIKDQLKNFRAYYLNKKFSDTPKPTRENDLNEVMRDVSAQLTDHDIEALSAYITTLN